LQVRGIPRDTWNMFLNFVWSVGTDLTLYDDTEAWPSLLDDFVEFENDQLNQNSSAMQDLNRENSLTPS
jgi:DCN1-like protein 3